MAVNSIYVPQTDSKCKFSSSLLYFLAKDESEEGIIVVHTKSLLVTIVLEYRASRTKERVTV